MTLLRSVDRSRRWHLLSPQHHPMRTSLLAVAGLAGLVACNSTDISKARTAHAYGDYAGAVMEMEAIYPAVEQDDGEIRHEPPMLAGNDNLWLLLETGKYHFDAGQWDQAAQAFREANTIFEILEEEASLSVGAVASGASMVLIDDVQGDYTGNTYDPIMANAYLSMAELMRGDFEASANAARNLDYWQVKAEELRAEAIAKAMERDAEMREAALEKKSDGPDLSASSSSNPLGGIPTSTGNYDQAKYSTGQQVHDDYDAMVGGLKAWAQPAMGDFTIAAARAMGAVGLMAAGYGGEAQKMKSVAQGVAGGCAELSELGLKPGRAVVFFETGCVPYRVDDSHWFIMPYEVSWQDENGRTFNDTLLSPVKVALPGLAFEGEGVRGGMKVLSDPKADWYEEASIMGSYRRVDSLSIGGTESTQVVTSLKGHVAREFSEVYGAAVFREVLRIIIRELLQPVPIQQDEYGNQKVNNFGLFGSLTVGYFLKNGFDPDLRGWQSLPAEIQIAVVDVPANGQLELSLSDDSAAVTLEGLSTETPVVIFARSSQPGTLTAHSSQIAPKL